MKNFTVNTLGNNMGIAKENGYHAYYASGITAIEVRAKSKEESRGIVELMNLNILYIFE